ncbi:hypothetical protein BH11PLA2_BH11PLA2_37150 [soil metagenome]
MANDTNNGNYAAGDLSLREAIALANLSLGSNTISFNLTSPATITLGGTQLPTLTDNTIITGPGAKALTISGNNASRILQFASGVTADVSGLTLTQGKVVGGVGGAILNLGNTTLTGTVLSGNTASYGGAIYSVNAATTIRNSTISGNSASGYGGGLWSDGTSSIINSTFSGNSAYLGGAIYNLVGPANITNTTISGNSATLYAGGINNQFGTVNLNNTIVAGNTAVVNFDVQGGFGGTNNILNMTAAAAGLGTFGDYGGSARTIPLLPGSPAINVGNSTGAPTTDQRGLPRFAAVDIGAFERQVTPAVTGIALNTTTLTVANVGPSGFTVTATFNGEMDTSVQPLVSFPLEPVNGTLTFNSGTWLNSTQWVAKYDVANSGVNLPNVDLRITGGKNFDGTTQTQFDAPDAFSIVMQAAMTGFIVNDGAVQRSRIMKIVVNFPSPVDAATLAALGGISLTRTAAVSGGTVGTIVSASNGLIVGPAIGMVNSVTLTFANLSNAGIENSSLTDGRWRLAIPSLSYQSDLNDPALRKIFGDADANGTVNGADLVAFGNAFASAGAGLPFDVDNNGTVNGADLVSFGNRFGVTL